MSMTPQEIANLRNAGARAQESAKNSQIRAQKANSYGLAEQQEAQRQAESQNKVHTQTELNNLYGKGAGRVPSYNGSQIQTPTYDNSALLEALASMYSKGRAENQKLMDAFLQRRLKSVDNTWLNSNKKIDKLANRGDGLYGRNLTNYALNSWNKNNSYADAYYDYATNSKAVNDDFRNNMTGIAQYAQNADPDVIRRIYGSLI